MFLYWKKRGAYELEALPGALAELELGAVERFSWSSTLDIIEDLGGRCRPTFPGGSSWGLDTWSTWPPPSGQSLWLTHHICAAAGGGEVPELEDPGGHQGRESRPGRAAGAPQLGSRAAGAGAAVAGAGLQA